MYTSVNPLYYGTDFPYLLKLPSGIWPKVVDEVSIEQIKSTFPKILMIFEF